MKDFLEECTSVELSDDQTLSIDGSNNLIISDGNSVSLSAYLDNTDSQAISLAANTLSISGNAGTVDLSGYLDNTDSQTLGMSTNTLSLVNGGSVDLSGYLDNTDDQTITALSYDNTNRTLTIAIENGNTISVSLDQLRQTITKTGNLVQLNNSGGSFDLTQYLDNTDDQQLQSMTFDSTSSELTISLEAGGVVTEVINFNEQDPTIPQHVKSITTTDIQNWNIDLVNDADSSVTNELDTLLVDQPGPSNEFHLLGNVTKGTTHVIRAVTIGTDGNQSLTIGTDDQKIQVFSFDTETDQLTLTLEAGGTKVVTLEGVGDVCEDYTGLTTSTFDPPTLSFSGDVDVYMNGMLMRKDLTPNHIAEFNISSQNIIFYENLESTDAIRVCVK